MGVLRHKVRPLLYERGPMTIEQIAEAISTPEEQFTAFRIGYSLRRWAQGGELGRRKWAKNPHCPGRAPYFYFLHESQL